MTDEPEILDSAKCREIGRRCPCYNLRRASRTVTRLYDDYLRPTGLRSTQCSVLVTARLRGPVSLTKLAELTVTDRTTLTRNLAILEKKGLVRIEPGTDRRERQVNITEQGQKAMAEAIPLLEAAQAVVESGIGEDHMDGLLKQLSAITSLSRKS